jgi:glutathione synthase
MRFVYVMDPMDRILPDKDTTFAFQRAAQRRGHSALHTLVSGVYLDCGQVCATVRPVVVSDTAPFHTFGAPFDVRLAEVDAVFIRKDPPFDAQYLYLTHILELLRGHTLVLNDPRGLREANEKLYTIHFAQHMPPTLVSADPARLLAFAESLGKAVIKPLDGAGGSGVLVLTTGDPNNRSMVDLLTHEGQRYAMLQQFLPAVRQGDKRVLLLDGEVLGAINRIPRSDDIRSNIHVGGSVEPCEVTSEERALVEDLKPRLLRDGLVFVGLDLIGGKLTEVNVTSPTGIQQLSAHVGQDMADPVIAWVESRVAGS